MQGRSYIWGNRGGRLGCFQDCCLSENNFFEQSNFTFDDCQDYIAVTYNRNCKRLSSSRALRKRPNWSLINGHASPYLWKQLPSSLRQPHSSPSVSDLPVHAATTFSHYVNWLNSPLWPSITPPLFYSRGSRPTSFTNLSHYRLPSGLRTDSTDDYWSFLVSTSFFSFFITLFFVWFRAED